MTADKMLACLGGGLVTGKAMGRRYDEIIAVGRGREQVRKET